jgi:hypothetical protein
MMYPDTEDKDEAVSSSKGNPDGARGFFYIIVWVVSIFVISDLLPTSHENARLLNLMIIFGYIILATIITAFVAAGVESAEKNSHEND